MLNEASQCMGYNGWSKYSTSVGPTDRGQWNTSHKSKMVETCYDWHCIPIISTPPPTLPLLPLSYGFHYSGMRVRALERSLRSTHALLNDVTSVSKSSTWQRNMSRTSIPDLYQHWRRSSRGEISKHWTHMKKKKKNIKGEKVESKWMLDKGMHASVSLSKLELESCRSTTAERNSQQLW